VGFSGQVHQYDPQWSLFLLHPFPLDNSLQAKGFLGKRPLPFGFGQGFQYVPLAARPDIVPAASAGGSYLPEH
jgi:hypothetical protein